MHMMVQKIGKKSRVSWEDHMSVKKVWKRKGTSMYSSFSNK